MDADPVLLGRGAELSELAGLVRAHRLVTVTGVGGVGKTTLASAVLDDAQDAAVCLLARHGTADLVAPAVAESLGYASWDAALAALPYRSTLLLLDNCEHVLDAAADVVEQLLLTSPGVSVLSTSREPLALPGERVFRLQPLALAAGPDVDDASASPAVQLFLARAAESGVPLDLDAGSAPTIAELCRRLDGLPLAIELAAVRVRTLTPAEILGHLDRRLDLLVGHRRAPARHRSLQAMVDWSYERLDQAPRRFFDRLGVAEGLFTAEAAHAIAGEPGEDLVTVVGHLDQLVAQSLVQTHRRGERTWYGLLETLRAYARARLVAAGEYDTTRNRCVDWTVRHCLELRERSRQSWSATFTSTNEALRLDVGDALAYVLHHDPLPDRAYPLFSLLWEADVHNGRARSTVRLGEEILARWPERSHPGWAEAAAIVATGYMVLGEADRGVRFGLEALAASPLPLAAVLARRALFLACLDGGGQAAIAAADAAIAEALQGGLRPWWIELSSLRAIALAGAGRLDEAVTAARTARDEALEADSPLLAAWCALVLGHLLGVTDQAAARTVLEAVVAGSGPEPLDHALGHRALGALDLLRGCSGGAARHLQEALDTLVQLGESHVGTTLRWVAALAGTAGRQEDAARLSAAGRSLPAAELSDLLARNTLDPRLPLVQETAEPLPTRAAVALAREVLAAAAAVADAAVADAGGTPTEADDVAVKVGLEPAREPAGVFRREGVVWTLSFDGATALLPDAKGLHDLAVLLAAPGREIHCSDLAGAGVDESDTGPVIDAQARAGYERRIVELQAELVEAEDRNDQHGADRARVEMDFLVDQLLAATGRAGRTRRAGGTSERARSAVGWRVRSAIGRIADVHPALAQHLRDGVRLGTWCSYQPPVPISWQL